jgi:HptB-dependent secretion and biofilm anti anti-sigma factor
MTIHAQVTSDGREMVISVHGRFDFSAQRAFRNSYERVTAGFQCYTVDMRDASYLDSSALGMLLLLRDHAGGDHGVVRIVNCNADVRRILAVSNFEQLFDIN